MKHMALDEKQTAVTRIDSDEQSALSLNTLTNHAFHQLYNAACWTLPSTIFSARWDS